MCIHGAVVFPDKINDPVWKVVLFCQFNAICYMADDGLGTDDGVNVIVWIKFLLNLVFNKELRITGFAAVMINRPDTNKQAVCTNRFRSLFRQVCHLQRMLITPRRVTKNLLQQWMIGT